MPEVFQIRRMRTQANFPDAKYTGKCCPIPASKVIVLQAIYVARQTRDVGEIQSLSVMREKAVDRTASVSSLAHAHIIMS